MVTTEFFLYSDLNSDVLVHLKSRVRVELYPLDCVDFQPAADQRHIYARLNGRFFAFEAGEYTYEHMDLLTKAALWYSRYLDAKMELFVSDPRPLAAAQRSNGWQELTRSCQCSY